MVAHVSFTELKCDVCGKDLYPANGTNQPYWYYVGSNARTASRVCRECVGKNCKPEFFSDFDLLLGEPAHEENSHSPAKVVA